SRGNVGHDVPLLLAELRIDADWAIERVDDRASSCTDPGSRPCRLWSMFMARVRRLGSRLPQTRAALLVEGCARHRRRWFGAGTCRRTLPRRSPGQDGAR